MSKESDTILSPSESCPIRQRISADNLRALDRMARRGFMKPVIEFGDCWECETYNGEGFVVPSDVYPIPPFLADGVEFEAERSAEDAERYGIPDPLDGLAQYMGEGCSGEVASAKVRRGVYLCRMSAPGYMDCTDWECHESAEDAAESIILYHGDDSDSGDDE